MSGNETQTAPDTSKIEEKIEGVADKIAETPVEDQDKQWRSEVNSSLAAISAALEKLTTSQAGKSPELASLETRLDSLMTKLDNLPTATPPATPEPPKEPKAEEPSKSAGDGNPTPVTPKVTSSAPKEAPAKPAAKQHRAKGKDWL